MSSRFGRAPSLAATCVVGVLAVAACGSSSPKDTSGLVPTDVAVQAGIAAATNTHGEDCVADFDKDHIPDVLLSTHGGVWLLLKGEANGMFVPYYKGLQPVRADTHGCAVADFNGDGLLDVYLAIGACQGACTNPKQLWIQQPDHSFVDEATKFGIADPGGRGREPRVVDANGDQWPDLFTGQDSSVANASLNRLWINEGGTHFALQQGPITSNLGNLCSAAADIDGDGLDEIAVCTPKNGFHIFTRDPQGVYVDATRRFGVTPNGRRDVHFVDVNGDGHPDLATVEQTKVSLFLNAGTKYPAKPVFEHKLTDGMDVALGDMDGDGDLDMFVKEGGKGPDLTFINEGGGRTWKPGPTLPPLSSGSGDTVVAIPNYRNSHRAAFIVNNGYETAVGARQLWVFSGP